MKKGSILMVAALTAALLGGCGGKTAGGDTGQSNTVKDSAATAENEITTEVKKDGEEEPVTLRFAWWGSDARHEATLKAIERYCELNPGVTIEGEYQGYDGYLQKLSTQMAGKTEPDLLQLDYIWYPELKSQGDIFVDLGQMENVDLSVYSESVLKDYCSIDGKVISLPMGSTGVGVLMNKEFFDKHGLSADTDWTWDKIIEEGMKIHAESPDDYLLSIESSSLSGFVLDSYIYSKTGAYVVNDGQDKVIASKEDLTEAFQVMKDLFDSGAAQPLGEASLFKGQQEQNPKWINAEMGMTIDNAATVGKYKAALDEGSFAVGMPPYVKNGDNRSIRFKPSMVLAVSNRSKNAGVAADFANWMMTDPEAVRILGTQRSIPTSDAALKILQENNEVDPEVAYICEATLKDPAPPEPLVLSNTEVGDAMTDICEQLIYGQLTPEQAADQFITDIQAKLDQLGAAE